MVRSHDGPGPGINDCPLERRHPTEIPSAQYQPKAASDMRGSQLPLATVNRSSVQSLLGVAEADKVLDHG